MGRDTVTSQRTAGRTLIARRQITVLGRSIRTGEHRASIFVAPYATLGAYASCRDALRADSDTSGRYRPRHRRDRRDGAAGTRHAFVSSTTARPDRTQMTTGQTELLEHGHRRRYRRHRTTSLGFGTTTGRMEQRADEAGVTPRLADCTTTRRRDPLESRLLHPTLLAA